MAWGILVFAGLLEIAWSSALKKSEGLRRLGWSIMGIALAIFSLVLLTFALRVLPVGTGYAVWVGIGTVGVALTGIIVFGEAATWARLAWLAAIITGTVGLKLLES